MGNGAADRAVVADLVTASGIGGPWRARPLAGTGTLNRHWLVETGGSPERFVARLYGWPFPGAEPFDRCAKEAWLLGELSRRGLPVPELLASARRGEVVGLLLGHLDGRTLGQVAATVAADDAAPAWRVAGKALRLLHDGAHDLVRQAGTVLAGGTAPFPEGSWGRWLAAGARHHAERLAARRPDLAAALDRGAGLVESAVPTLDAAPVTLLHGDPHPWNVLVHRTTAGRWACTGWLDWEFALGGDAEYDLARSARSRLVDLGPLPAAFGEGYGRAPDPARDAVHEFSYHLRMADDSRYFAHRASYDDAWRYLAGLPARLDRLARLLR